ncbi:hypothetical protein QAD02_015786 [Eretmocerus hayati]|uniref:Uncharacterized protein n=1 Tax=Eretmocerus hayati TaxID=131215 RepID=A0ACC2PBP1_9HYME|nr:hypothetical protein QAD02_015786 [Eretmocerus hayati]
MHIINATTFCTITHNLKFEPENVKNGTQLAVKEHVRDVTELKHSIGSFLIQAKIVRQTSVTTTPYRVQLHLDQNRHLVNAFCTCVSNKGEKYKHIYSVIHFVNHHQALSKTDQSQEWGKPTPFQFAKDKYSKGNYALKLFGKDNKPYIFAKNPKLVPYPQPQLSELYGRSHVRCIYESASKLKLKQPCHQVPVGLLIKQAQLKLRRNECEAIVDTLLLYAEEYQIYCQDIVLDKKLKQYYDEKIAISREDIIALSCDTVKQSDSDLWFAARSKRISASKGVHSIKTRDKKTAESLASDMVVHEKLILQPLDMENLMNKKLKSCTLVCMMNVYSKM